MTPQEIEALKAERDALLQELHKANSIIVDLQRNPPKFTAEHLRDVQAEAVKNFVEFNAGRYSSAFEAYINDALKTYLSWAQQGGAE